MLDSIIVSHNGEKRAQQHCLKPVSIYLAATRLK